MLFRGICVDFARSLKSTLSKMLLSLLGPQRFVMGAAGGFKAHNSLEAVSKAALGPLQMCAGAGGQAKPAPLPAHWRQLQAQRHSPCGCCWASVRRWAAPISMARAGAGAMFRAVVAAGLSSARFVGTVRLVSVPFGAPEALAISLREAGTGEERYAGAVLSVFTVQRHWHAGR